MPFLSLPLYPSTFPIKTNTKWRIRHLVIGSSNNTRHQNMSRTSRSCFIRTSSTKGVIIKVASAAAAAAVAVPTETMPTEKSNLTSELKRMRNGGFWFRKWHMMDVTRFCLGIVMHGLAVTAPFVFNMGALWVTLVLSYMSGMGVTLGYHRLLTHRSFKLPKWLEYCFTYCGSHAGQGDPLFWASVHKNHHKYTDGERDPHSPHEGFWYSHFGWIHYNEYLAVKCGQPGIGEYTNIPELKQQWFYRFLQDTHVWHIIGLGVLLYLVGGYPYLAWGMGMRHVFVSHITFIVGPVCHSWGDRPYQTTDTSTNNWVVALLTFGEGWHNNHHAFPKSARHGMEWWQLDLTWVLIKFLEMIGLATDVYLPTEADINTRKRSLN